MVLAPLNVTCTQSGYVPALASFQPPPLPQFVPVRSLLLTAETGHAVL